jgi:hypothetical protein
MVIEINDLLAYGQCRGGNKQHDIFVSMYLGKGEVWVSQGSEVLVPSGM